MEEQKAEALRLKEEELSEMRLQGFPGGSDAKESDCNAGDPGSISGSGRSLAEGNGNPVQFPVWRIPNTEGPGGPQSRGLQRVGHDSVTNFSLH